MTELGLLLLTCLSVQQSLVYGETLTISTPSGDIEGLGVDVVGIPGAKTYQFRKVPYAKPPVGNLRFQKPQPYGKWNGTLNATAFGPNCMQLFKKYPFDELLPNTDISENCLFLNIYLPHGIDTKKQKSVMVWIHGGSYLSGQGMYYDASYMAAKSDVIMVTINYRLGMFGFATLQNKNMRGNYGIWDQILALRWVHDNIRTFGGDPNSVTVFGESAGGFSVALLALVSSNKGLFQRVIAQSGVANSLFAVSRINLQTTISVGTIMGCNPINLQDFVSCLKRKSGPDILNATLRLMMGTSSSEIHLMIPFAPVVDNELFHDLPENLLRNSTTAASEFFKSLDIIIGNVNSEGSLLLNFLPSGVQSNMNFDIRKGLPYRVFCERLIKQFVIDYYNRQMEAKDAICAEYGIQNDLGGQARRAVDFFTDLFFISTSVSSLRYHSQANSISNTYFYIFTDDGIPFAQYPRWFRGAAHSVQLLYFFGLRKLSTYNVTISAQNLTLSDQMIAYWTNFAKTGDPNDGDLKPSVEWPQFESVNESYITLDEKITTGMMYNHRAVKFWLHDIPTLLSDLSKGSNNANSISIYIPLLNSSLMLLMVQLFCYQ